MPLTLSLVTPDGEPAWHGAVPTSWADITVAQYLRLLTETELPRICVLTTLEEETLNQIAAQDAAYLFSCVAFVEDESELLELKPSPDLVDMGSASYGQLLLVQQFMAANPDQIMLAYAPWMYAVYESERQLRSFNSNARMQHLYEATLAAPLPTVYADLMAFLQAWSSFMRGSTRPQMTTNPKTMSWRQVLRNWVSASPRF